MENFVKQMRVRFSGIGQDSQEKADSKISQRRLPSQKTQSFKKGKGQQNWFKRQFSGDMSKDNYFSDSSEYATAVAAAAFAVYSIDDTAGLQDGEKTTGRSGASLTKIKSRKDQEQGEASTKNSTVEGPITAEDAAIKHTEPKKTAGRVPTMRTPSFADNFLNGAGPKQLESAVSTESYKYPRDDDSAKPRSSTIQREKAAIAETWEKSKLQRTKKKYDRVNSTILSWESEKKAKAKRRLDRIKGDTAKRSNRTLQHYHSEISRIEQIAAGARAAAEEKRRNKEFKIKEKANKIRATGKVPAKCFCF